MKQQTTYPIFLFSYFKPLLRFLSYFGNWCQQLWFRIANPKEGEVSELNNREKVWQIHRMVISTGKMVISKIIKLIREIKSEFKTSMHQKIQSAEWKSGLWNKGNASHISDKKINI